ncbi:MAG: hypothetical protein ABIP03_06030 [Aquihabitans sp.]
MSADHLEPGTKRAAIAKLVAPTHAELGWKIARVIEGRNLIHVERHADDVWTISVTV